MKKIRNGKWIVSLGAAIMFLFSFIFSTGGGIFSVRENGEFPSDPITASAAGENANYDTLVDGTVYYYTDETKIDLFRDGTVPSDTSEQTVNLSATHGTAANPFVINTAKQWRYFASDTTNAAKSTNVFVLGSDIDFNGKTGDEAFLPVPSLGAKFYGCNHVLSNITYSFKTGSTYNINCGLFRVATATAVIADVSVRDAKFTGTYTSTGFICGHGSCSILNCHATGTISDAYVTNDTHYEGGAAAIVGRLASYTKNIYLYRCSASMFLSLATVDQAGNVAGLCADVDYGASGKGVSVYDCFVSGKYQLVNGSSKLCDPWFGGAIHIGRYAGGAITHRLENIVAYTEMTDQTSSRRSEGSLFNGWNNGLTGAVTLNVRNTYSSGKLISSGSQYASNGTYDMKPAVWYTGSPGTNNFKHDAVSNSNWYGTKFCYMPTTNTSYDSYAAQGLTAAVNQKQWSTQADMYANVKLDATFPAKIWVNKGIIDNAYMTGMYGTSSNPYTIENSPVRNPLKITVSYYNYKLDGDEAFAITESEAKVVKAGESLYEPTAQETGANRKFLGWTTDKSGQSEPFKAVPTTMLGDNKLYAVWELDQKSVKITATGNGEDFAFDSAAGEASMTYKAGGGITLTANLTAAGMSDPDITYQWEKDGTAIESGGTAQSYKVENVKESGSYNVSLKIKSTNEPLFRGEVASSLVSAVKTTIKPSPLTCRGATFKEGDHPYSGAPYDTAVPEAYVVNADGIKVNGRTVWESDLGWFNDEDKNAENLADGKETKEIRFFPDEEYGGNYGEYVTFEITFEIEFLTFTFNIPRINRELSVNLEYGQHYTYNNVATLFENAFAEYMGSLAGNTPAFIVGDKTYKINEYRQLGTGGNTTAYGNVTESHTIEVTFVPQSYTVTYDARNEGQNTYDPVTVGHGIRLAKPMDPKYGNQLFLGWFYEYTEDDATEKKERAWNFDADRVTRELELYAKWLEADTLEPGLIVTESPIAKYIAKEPLDPSMLTVKAVFKGRAEGKELTQEVILTRDQYEILYEDGATVLHAKAGNEKTLVTIRYVFKKGQTEQVATASLNLQVQKIGLDTTKLKKYFKDTAVVVKDEPQTMTINRAYVERDIPELTGCEITYKYFNSQEKEIGASDIQKVGTYYIRVYFAPDDTDYDAPYIQAKFQIVNEKIKLTVEWGEVEFVYNGKVQVPTPTFKDEQGETVVANYVLTGDTEARKAGSNYTVTITIEDLAYELVGTIDRPFAILPATLKVPTQTKPFSYNGMEYDLNQLDEIDCETYFEGFDLSLMEVRSGDGIKGDKGKDASRYNATVVLRDPDSAKFENGQTRTTMSWQIEKAKLTVDWNSYEFYENSGIQVPKVVIFYEFFGDDADLVDYTKDIEYMGDINAMTYGEYTITVIIKPDTAWAKNYELDGSKTCSFVILPKAGMEVISIVWDTNTLFEYNGSVQRPTFRVKNRVGSDITESVPASEFRFNEEAQNSKWAGDYSVTVTMRPGSNYFLTGDTSCLYTITKNAAGEGENPDNPGNNGGGDNPITGTVELPLWQLIVGGVSAILFLICTARSFGEYGKYKAAKKEAKELAAVSYSVTYGFAPLPLLAISFLGASETVWTAIACAALGLFLLSLAAMLILGKKRKAAELVVRREKARIEDEKEYARQEEQMRRDEEQRLREEQMRAEQQRRDEEFRMMFAAMQQNYQQPQVGYDDMQNMIASAVTALLPGLQQSMQALPPAQSDASAYNMPQQNSEAEALRAQMAAQQAQMEAQMAQQQELINQLLQNQAQAASAQAYDEAAAAADEAFWIDESEKIVSLEELYGKLSDDAKRCYYEIGSYIMNKPRTMQNDGKYAVLFKYRGKTLFKLCIKEDAPVLYYSTDDGGKSEVKINSAEALEAARKIVDLRIAQTDSTM